MRNRLTKNWKATTVAILAVCGIWLATTGESCGGGDEESATEKDTQVRQDATDAKVENQPYRDGPWSPNLETSNFYADTWYHEQGKLAYTYVFSLTGEAFGYYITVGPMLTNCATANQPYKKESIDTGDFTGETIVPERGSDGLYYSGGQCDTYYGRDAISGAYVEFTDLSFSTSDQPLPAFSNAKAIGPTSIEDAQNYTPPKLDDKPLPEGEVN